MSRLKEKFKNLKQRQENAFISFITAGDPDFDTSLRLLIELPKAGVDIIELGIAFTDPMADGPEIQASSQRALEAGQTVKKTLEMVRLFRDNDQVTPIVLMGYYNPIYIYGVENFLEDAKIAGVDGLIIVDLPPEEDEELCIPSSKRGIDFIRLITPTTDEERLKICLKNSSGFIYYVSVTGITGVNTPAQDEVFSAVTRLKKYTDLPIGVGFGIKTSEQAKNIAQIGDATIVGSVFSKTIRETLDHNRKATSKTIKETLKLAQLLSDSVKSAKY